LANAQPQRAFAILKATESGGLVVSVRAPLCAPKGAGELCRRFGGGGRLGAAGIDNLPMQEMGKFLHEFSVTQWGES
jgi:hypothetical protein